MFYTLDTAAASQNKQITKRLKAPIRGLIRNQNIADTKDGGAYVLENWFPTTKGIVSRRGKVKWATLSGSTAVGAIMSWQSAGGANLFAANNAGIYDITSVVDPDVALTAETGTGVVSSGDFSHVMFTTSGGAYLMCVNGVDSLFMFDGTYWTNIGTADIKSLAYDAQTGNFTEGLVVTGGTSGATATIYRDIDGGTTGTLWVTGITGTFQDNETITDTSTGSADSNIPTGVSTLYTGITGITTDTWSHIWSFKNTIFAVKKNSQSFVYLPVDSIAGAAATFNLGGVFKLGGTLLTGGTWSVDAGDGMDDLCVFISTEGEVAAYAGTDPSDANAWALKGTYKIGRPLGKKALFRAGGDLMVATNDGLISIAAAFNFDRSSKQTTAASYPIEELWLSLAQNRNAYGWCCETFPARQMLFIGTPSYSGSSEQILVANIRTGAWTIYTNYDVRSMHNFNNQFFVGTSDSIVYETESAALDDTSSYECRVALMWDDFGYPASFKSVKLCRAVFSSYFQTVNPKFSVSSDYQVTFPSPPDAVADPAGGAVWGSGTWGASAWGNATTTEYRATEWKAVEGSGASLAVQCQVTLGNTTAPDIELSAIDVVFEKGASVA